jgi:hypothetical protein
MFYDKYNPRQTWHQKYRGGAFIVIRSVHDECTMQEEQGDSGGAMGRA